MQSEDRIIHFGVELIHAAVRHKKDALQRLYFELSQVRGAGYDSTDFTHLAQPRFYSKRGKRSQSICLFLPDRVLLLEEWADITTADFVARVKTVAERVLTLEGIDQFIAHTATIRSTFALTHVPDGRVFLLEHVCGQDGSMAQHFQRPIATAGVRFHFPDSEEYPGNLQVSIEPFRQSQKEIYVEAKGIFTRDKIRADRISTVADHCRGVRSFISDRVYPYLDQFDVPRAALE